MTATDDTDNDDGESITISFGSPPTGYLASGTTTVNLADNDQPNAFTFAATSYTATEGGTAATVEVNLSRAPATSVSIPLTVIRNGGATSADHSAVPATVTFSTTDTSKTFTVTATDDTDNDDGESITISFGSPPTGYLASGTSTVNLADNDQPNAFTFAATSYTATEGGTAATVEVNLSRAPATSVSIPLTVIRNGGATSADHSAVPATVTFSTTDTSKTFTVTATDDTDNDDGESITISFGSPPTGYLASGTSTVNLADNDQPNAFTFAATSYTATEGGTAATVEVNLSRAPATSVSIPLTVIRNGGATSADHSAVPATVTFSTTDTSKTFTVTATDDTDNDDGESITISFGSPPTGYLASGTSTVTVNLADNDQPNAFTFAATSYTATEGGTAATVEVNLSREGGTAATVEVNLSRAPATSVSIPLTVIRNGGATSADHSAVPATVTFSTTDTSKTFTVTATDDTDNDDGESITISFGSPPTGYLASGTSTVNLADNDQPNAFTFAATSYTATEGGTAATVEVNLSRAPATSVSIPLTVIRNGGATSADHSAVPATVTFSTTDTSKTFTVTATDDTDNDDGESITISFGSPPTGYLASGTSTVNLADNDATVLVDNLGQARDRAYSLGSYDYAQRVNLGAHAAGYTLTSVELRLEAGASDITVPIVKLVAVDNSWPSTTVTVTLTGPAALTANTTKNYTFTDPANTTLTASTGYFVTVEGASGDNVYWTTTLSGSEDTAAPGWSIQNNVYFGDLSQPSNMQYFIGSLLLRVNGEFVGGRPVLRDSKSFPHLRHQRLAHRGPLTTVPWGRKSGNAVVLGPSSVLCESPQSLYQTRGDSLGHCY